MTSSEADEQTEPQPDPMPDRRYSRRLIWLAVGIVLLFGGYAAAWFIIADRVEKGIDAGIVKMRNEDGVTAACDDRAIGGFPFRFELYCNRVAYDNPPEGVAFEAGALRSARQIYDLKHTVGELDGPLTIAAPFALRFDWSLLQASVREAKPLPERVAIATDGLKVTDDGGSRQLLFSADHAEAHMRTNAADIDVAANFTNLAIDPAAIEGRAVPPLSGKANATITGGVALVDGEPPVSLRGQGGQIHTLELAAGEGRVTVSGPLSFDADGLANGQLSVAIENPGAVGQALQQAVPEQANAIRTAFAALALMGDNPTLPLTIDKGEARLGFIPLGDIPAVD